MCFVSGSKAYLGSDVDPERSTKNFSILDKGKTDEKVSGRIITSDTRKPFRELNAFGPDFLENLNHILVEESELLENCYIVDTPGQ